jgi:simple sugar transport system ATP-binding protein
MSPEKGELRLLGGLNEASSLKQRITAGLRLVPEDRHSEAIISDWNLLENTALGLQFLPPEANGRWIDTDSRQKLASQIVDRFRTKNGGLDKPIASLSGGNQQRLVVARALALSPKLIMAFQPVRGLDLGATAAIYAAIKDACAEGMAAVIVSFDLDELLVNCPRILVLNQGRLSEPPKELALDRSTIGDLMVGAA